MPPHASGVSLARRCDRISAGGAHGSLGLSGATLLVEDEHEHGWIKSYSVSLDVRRLGLKLLAFVQVRTGGPGLAREVSARLAEIEEVQEVPPTRRSIRHKTQMRVGSRDS